MYSSHTFIIYYSSECKTDYYRGPVALDISFVLK